VPTLLWPGYFFDPMGIFEGNFADQMGGCQTEHEQQKDYPTPGQTFWAQTHHQFQAPCKSYS